MSHTNVKDENETRTRSVYAMGWAVHQLLQLHQQSFLFDNLTSYRLTLTTVLLVLLFSRRKDVFLLALLVRNVARARRCPFLWDSEFWLALTDLSVALAMLLSMYYAKSRPSAGFFVRGALPWIRTQLAIQYAACALFKLNTAFLHRHTSCAPIFVLSLLVKTLPGTAQTMPQWALELFADIAPWSVVVVEALIALFLFFHDARVHDIGIGLALIFHALIAVTPRPNGVPTFSCVAISRLFLLIGNASSVNNNNNNNNNNNAPPAVRILHDGGSLGRAAAGCVAMAAIVLSMTRDVAIVLYFSWCCLCILALMESCRQRQTTVVVSTRDDSPPALWTGRWMVGLATFYAIVPPMLGLQEIGSNTMFANLRLHGGTNHIWGLPTGLLQQWWYHHHDADDDIREHGTHAAWYHAFGGGVVRVEYTDSEHLNQLYPGEMTEWLSPDLRALLTRVGHASRQFNPKARRVLGPAARARMPWWNAANGTFTNLRPFVRYTVPALELRRLLHEATVHAQGSFALVYTRLVGATGNETWRRQSQGVLVYVQCHKNGTMNCRSRDEPWLVDTDWAPCRASELALLPPPPWWATKFMLFYPYAIPVEHNVEELLCNY